MTSPEPTKIRRNLRALFALGFFLALLASIGGGLILTVGYSRPNVVQPVWQFGQSTMFSGLVNFLVYLGILFQVRKLALVTAGPPTVHPRPERVREFLAAFEQVFDRDWDYTKEMLGIDGETEEQRRNATEFGMESIPVVAGEATFIDPKVDDEVEDWGNRARLLEAYRALKKELP